MGDTPFRADLDELRDAAQRFRGIAAHASRTANDHQIRVAAEDGSWGSDEPGNAVESGYRSPADSTNEAIESLTELFEAIARSIDAAADRFEGTDTNSAGSFDTLSRGI
ncbi:WXG100 family type VII secretion target [Lolliginicoccus suaedae]|uniref:WXG100 family type VII secretion target n=1 Tax=Lolliginicoccus suaedae TaxID=2605429 RepID=UPI0016598BD4|nr:type VII secretion target [Lolliginicoccus suaedae]